MSKTALTLFMIAGLSVAYAHKGPKTYDVRIPDTATVGSNQLKAGDYKLRVEGSKAYFTDENSRKTVEADVVVGTVAKKYGDTEVEMSKLPGGGERLTEIRINGSRMKLDFPN